MQALADSGEGRVRGLLSRWGGTILLLAVLIIGVPLVLVSPTFAEHFVFFPSRAHPGPPPVLAGVAGEDVTLTTSDGVRIHGWWHEAAPGAPAVVLFHGNAGNIAGRAPLAAGYLDRGVSVFMPDYRGYGASEGSPSEEGVYRDGEAALEFVVERVGEPGRVVVHGRSLGGAVAAQVVRERRVAGLVLESTFTSLDEIAASAYPIFPALLFRRLRGRFDTRSAIREIQAPILVVHGTDDTLVPVEMGQALFEEAGEPKDWYGVEGAGHNDVYGVGGEDYFRRLGDFVEEVTRRTGEGASPVRGG